MRKIFQKQLSLLLSITMVLGMFVALPGVPAQAAAVNHVVINEVYGGGGNSGATYKNDFIELYNPTAAAVDLSTWSVQYASAAGTFSTNITSLSGTISAGGYYLIQEAVGTGGTTALPTPDAIGTIGMSGTTGKVALVNNATAITKMQNGVGIVDFVGFGSASEYEGTGPTIAPSNTMSVARRTDGNDTDDNKADFIQQSPAPQNSSSSSGPVVVDSGVVFTPSMTPDAQNYVDFGTTVALSCSTVGADIYYKVNSGTDTKYSAPIEINEETTISAWIVKDSQIGQQNTVTYKVNAPITTISGARQAGSGRSATLTGVATNAYSSALGIYIQDGTGGIMLYGDSVLKTAGIQPGDTVQATGKTSLYSGKFELDLASGSVKITSTPGTVPNAKVTAISGINESVGGMLIQISGAAVSSLATDTYNNVTMTLTQDGKTISAKFDSRRGDDYLKLAAKIKNNQVADVTAIVEGYNGTYTLQLRSADDVTNIIDVPVIPKVAPVTANPGSSVSAKVGDTVTLSCATAGAVIHYTLDPTAADSDYLMYSSNSPITLTALPTTITAYATLENLTQSDKFSFTYRAKFEGKYNLYFGQLHSHTNISDGVGSVGDAFSYASQAKNLDFLAVTDHSNYFETAAEATAHANTILDGSKSADWNEGKAAAATITNSKVTNADNADDPTSAFLGIYGYEMTWSDGSGHINTFNTPGFEDRQNATFKNKNQSASNPIGLKTYYDALTTVPQSISQFNHPGTTFGDFYDFANYSPAYDKVINLIEVGNGEGPVRGVGYFPSYEYYTRALDKGWHVAPTNNQDNHKGAWGDANTARSVILAPELTEASLYDALQNCRVYSTEDDDLNIRYTVDDAVMGSEISVAKGEDLNIKADLSDPTDTSVGKVEVIVNGGRVAATQQLNSNSGTVSFTIPNNYSYYYLRVTEPDKDIAVTAPVWTSAVDKAGISSTTADTILPIKGDSCNITTSLYNNEDSDMTVESLEYKIGESTVRTVNGADLTGGAVITSLSTKNDSFAYTPQTAGGVTINVILKAQQGGVERTYTNTFTLQVADPAAVTKVLIDGTHFNDYVSGYYSQSMGNLTNIAADDGTQVRVETGAITPEMLANTQMLVISAPSKSTGSSKVGGSYTPQTFSDDFIQMVKEYVQNGGLAVISGLADYQDGSENSYTSSTQINKLLDGIGAKTTISNDEVTDQDKNGGQSYRLYFQNFNVDSPIMKGVDTKQQYSFYSGCSVNPSADAQWLVKGFDSTYSINSKASGGQYESNVPVTSATAAYDETKAVKKKGDVCALAQENVGAGQILVAGTVFLSDFEVKADVDNNWDLPYANYTIAKNLLDSVKIDIPTTSIADVRKNGQLGDVYEVEGTVTAGSEQPNAFTDTVYIQDATGGINIYPIANGSGIKVGQKLRVVGHMDEYQGDKELKIGSGVEQYEIIDTTQTPIAPTVLSVSDAADYAANGGLLAQTTGIVSDVQSLGGVVQSFMLTDGGKQIRVLMNGYINPNVDLNSVVRNGASVSVVGLVYIDPEGVCLRVHDRNEVKSTGGQSGGNHHDDSSSSPTNTTPTSATTVVSTQEGGKTIATATTQLDSAPVVNGNHSSLEVTVPSILAETVSAATSQNPVEVRIATPSAELVEQLNNAAIQTVSLNIQLASAVANNTNANAKVSINLPAIVLQTARDTQKDITIAVTDAQTGKEIYSWSFSGKALKNSFASTTNVDLAITAAPTAEGTIPNQTVAGTVLRFGGNGLLPAPANVRIYVGGQPGVVTNANMYLYYFNSTANVLEEMPKGKYMVDANGFITITISHCSEYVLLPTAVKNPYPVKSDTTFPLSVPKGKEYTFAITVSGEEKPAFAVGNGRAFTTAVTRKNGKYYVTVKAVGAKDVVTALYTTMPGKKPVVMCWLAVK